MQALFAWHCGNTLPVSNNSPDIISHVDELNEIIVQNAPKWPLEKINKVDLSILRCALWEMIYQDTPPRVVIDESIEMAKEFGTDTSSSFINGVIGSVVKTNQIIAQKIEKLSTKDES